MSLGGTWAVGPVGLVGHFQGGPSISATEGGTGPLWVREAPREEAVLIRPHVSPGRAGLGGSTQQACPPREGGG